MPQTALILGAGAPDGIGGALARKVAGQGFHVVVAGRTQAKIDLIAEEVRKAGGSIEAHQTDVTSSPALDQLFARLPADDPLSLVVYNAGINAMIPFETLTDAQMETFLDVCFKGGYLTAKRALPRLKAQGHGSLFFTGASASLRGKAEFGHFAAAKGALRNLAQALAREYGPHGVHVAHFIIDGIIGGARAKERLPDYLEGLGEDGALSPDAIADAYWYVHQQPRNAWTHELDLRPFKESW